MNRKIENREYDILTRQKAEVLELALTTFDRELYEQGLREEGEKIGEARGAARGAARGEARGIVETYQEFGKSQEETMEKLMDKLGVSEAEAKESIEKYWKKK